MMACVSARLLTVTAVLSASIALAGDTGTDSAHKHAWGENVGWANAGPTNYEVTVSYYEGTGGWLSGHAWGENIGWIEMGSAGGGPYVNTTSNNWGVNLAEDGKLTGYAWGENVGWINFEQTHGQPAIEPSNGEFSGHAWGENIGWLKFKGTSPEYGMRTLAFDTQPKGTPNWWLDHYGVTEGHDAGDGVQASDKYVMDTDPNVAGDYLRITALFNEPAAKVVAFTPASTRRYYTLTRRDDLTEGGWSNVVGQVAVPGIGGGQTLEDTNTAARAFYAVRVSVEP
jgi:hypothetical protein